MTNMLFTIGCAALITYLFSEYLKVRDAGWSFRYIFQRTTYEVFRRLPHFIQRQVPELAFSPIWPVVVIVILLSLLSYKAGEFHMGGSFVGYGIVGVALLWIVVRMAARSIVVVRCRTCYIWIPMLSDRCPYCGSRLQLKKVHSPPQRNETEEIERPLDSTGEKEIPVPAERESYPWPRILVFLAYLLTRALPGGLRGIDLVLLAGIAVFLGIILIGRIVSIPAGEGGSNEGKSEFMCTDCGTTVAEEDTKCPNCGVSFEEEEDAENKSGTS